VEGEDLATARVGVEAVGEARRDAGGLVEERKRADGGGGENAKNLVIQYTTTPQGDIAQRAWTNVPNLRNGLTDTEELLRAGAVTPDGQPLPDSINGPWVSVAAPGWRIMGLSNTNGAAGLWGFSNDLEIYYDNILVTPNEAPTAGAGGSASPETNGRSSAVVSK